jgi:hypothetical protein
LAKGEDKINPHFIGAVVLKQVQTKTSDVDRRLVIDGQQRITTLQILLKAVIDFIASQKSSVFDSKIKGPLQKMVRNEDVAEEEGSEFPNAYKIRPSKRDSLAFSVIMQTKNPSGIKKIVKEMEKAKLEKNSIIEAYKFFHEQVEDWFDVDADDRLGVQANAMKQTLLKGLELVFIDLAEDDKEQVIFETLNARGTPLLQFDLVKNFLYYQAETNKLDVVALDKKYWSFFRDESGEQFWEETVRQGRLNRPASDVFLHHYLTLKLMREVDATELFREYQAFVGKKIEDVEGHIKELIGCAKIYKQFTTFPKGTYEKVFFDRLHDMDNTTIYPLLMGIFFHLPGEENQSQRDRMLQCLESFIVRRAVCKLTPKNYNNLFVEIYKKLVNGGDFTVKALIAILKGYTADTNKWPDIEEFRKAWETLPLYKTIPARAKLRLILKALNNELHDEKSEGGAIEEVKKLTVEHIMPQSWEENWPLEAVGMSEEQKKVAVERRNILIHSVGNLTLTTGSLNPALSNSAWNIKKEELQKHSVITMNRLLVQQQSWSEADITKRSKDLFALAVKIWPDQFD